MEPTNPTSSNPNPSSQVTPQPVVQVLSPRGVEYVFLTINLFVGAFGLLLCLLAIINGQANFEYLSVPVAMLAVATPLFAWLFLRLKKAELRNPSLKLDASKRRSTQTVQIVSYLAVFVALIVLVATIFSSLAGKYDGSLGKVALNVLAIVVVAGGILAYYWRDEHKG